MALSFGHVGICTVYNEAFIISAICNLPEMNSPINWLHRGVTEAWKGCSVVMKEHGQWAELAGHDYVMDLIADMELMRNFPKQKSYFIISAESPTRTRPNASLSVSA